MCLSVVHSAAVGGVSQVLFCSLLIIISLFGVLMTRPCRNTPRKNRFIVFLCIYVSSRHPWLYIVGCVFCFNPECTSLNWDGSFGLVVLRERGVTVRQIHNDPRQV